MVVMDCSIVLPLATGSPERNSVMRRNTSESTERNLPTATPVEKLSGIEARKF
jgi:hypothetical protein